VSQLPARTPIKGNGRGFSRGDPGVESRAIAHNETAAAALIHRPLPVTVSIVSIVLAGGCTDPAWSHPASADRGQAQPMIQFDQFLIAMVVCFVAAHLLTAT
jgi:hypothetical protein